MDLAAYQDELGFLWLLALNGAVLWALFRGMRRIAPDTATAAADAIGLWYLVQYVSIGLPGILGVLAPWTMTLTAALLTGGIYFVTRRMPQVTPVAEVPAERWSLRCCGLFLLGYLVTIALHQRAAPIISDDVLAYHAPAAVQWLQTSRLDLFESWFHSASNTYSPLAGSAFIAWLMAPLGTDLAARYVQQPAVMFVFFLCIGLFRRLGLSALWVPLAALVVVTCRPVIMQSFIAKDDSFVLALFLWAVQGLVGGRKENDQSPAAVVAWRAAVALGLLLSVKYTVLLALPMLLFALPIEYWRQAGRSRWLKDVGIITAAILLLAAPWYVRNAWLTGNPLFPVKMAGLPGLFAMLPNGELRSLPGAWMALTGSRYSLPLMFACIALPLWLVAGAMDFRRIWGDPLRRVLYLAPPVGLAIFFLASPYAEIRFAYPAMALLLIGGVGLAGRFFPQVTLPLLLISVLWTSFGSMDLRLLALGGLGALPLVVVFLLPKRTLELGGLFAVAILLVALYVVVPGFVQAAELTVDQGWQGSYGRVAEGWAFLRKQTRKEPAVVAYTGMYQVYALYGFRLQNRVIYVPVQAGIDDASDVPPAMEPLNADTHQPWWLQAFQANPDEGAWLTRLQQSGARYFFLAQTQSVQPPETEFIARHSERFELLFQNEASAVYRIR